MSMRCSRSRDFYEFLSFVNPQRQWLLDIHVLPCKQAFLGQLIMLSSRCRDRHAQYLGVVQERFARRACVHAKLCPGLF